jgi:Transposase DDE domain group 1
VLNKQSTIRTEGFRVNGIMTNRSRARQQRIVNRLDKFNFPDDLEQPMFRAANIQYEVAQRSVGTPYGGIGLVHQLAKTLGLPAAIDQRLHLFKIHLPYHESDHVLNIAYNALCDGRCLQDLELRRQDEAYLNALGAWRIPDPTTAGDFCRRFKPEHLEALQQAIDVARRKAWAGQPDSFFDQARIDADGSIVETDGECKQGIDISYDGRWSYHVLAVTLANTGEVMRLVNRSGNRPSHEGAADKTDEAIGLCRAAGFRSILLRGDTDFSQTVHLDRWHEQGVTFCFGLDSTAKREILADDLPESAFQLLNRPAKYEVRTKPRRRPERVKQQIVEERGFKDIHLVDEWVGETTYRPVACQRDYRLIILQKNVEVREPQQQQLFDDYIYFFYLTNDWDSTPEEIVFSANDRCQQENILAQLNAVRALHAPLDNLLSNNAYMLITSLAWNLKAWLALSVPEPCGFGKDKQAEQKRGLLAMEFRTFVNSLMRVPAQIVRTGRRLVIRLLAWNQWQPVFLKLVARLCRPQRC